MTYSTRGTMCGTFLLLALLAGCTRSGVLNTAPSFTGAVVDQTYTVGEAIGLLPLPAATGGNGDLRYSLKPQVPGLTFDPTAQMLTGTPSTAGAYEMTYTVVDADENMDASDADELMFTITVEKSGPNRPPYVSAGLLAPDLQVRTGRRSVSFELTDYFDDTDGDPLEFDSSSSDTAVASATVADDVLRVAAVGPGRATITVTATDPDGASATQEFEVSVTDPNQPPYVSAELLAPDLQVRMGTRWVSFDLTEYFDDTDGDPLEFDSSSSDTAVASATVAEDVLRVAAVGPGRATITVTAMDPDGASAMQEFEVSVTAS